MVRSQNLDEAISQACSELPKLQISVKLAYVEKIQKIVAAVKESQ